jgi:hypothetical protein
MSFPLPINPENVGLMLTLGMVNNPVIPDANRLMFASTRLVTSTWANPAVVSGYEYQYSRLICGSPDYGINTLYAYFPNWRRQQSAGSPTEVSPGNSITINATIDVAGVITPVLFSGVAGPYTIADGGGIWASAAVSIPAGTTFFVRTECQAAIGATRIGIGRPYTNQSEGIIHAAAQDTGYLDGSKTPVGIGAASNIYAYGPTAIVAKGWDGRPVALLTGDSIAYGNDANATTNRAWSSRGNVGYWQSGLDDTVNGRIPFGLVCVPGLTSVLDDSAADLPKTLAMLEDPIFGSGVNYRPPFTCIVSEMGVNDFDASTGASRYPTPVKAQMLARIAFWTARYPGLPFVQSTLTPRATSTALYSWTDPTQQTPVGTDGVSPAGRWAFNDDLLAGNIAGVTASVDVSAAFSDPTNRDRWRAGTFSTTLSATASAGATTISLPIALVPGDNVCFEPGAAAGENRAVVSLPTGSGPYIHTVNAALTNTHTSGAVVKDRVTDDGVHPIEVGSRLALPYIQAAKAARKFG